MLRDTGVSQSEEVNNMSVIAIDDRCLMLTLKIFKFKMAPACGD